MNEVTAHLCAPIDQLTNLRTKQAGVNSLTAVGDAFIGNETLSIACLIEVLKDAGGNRTGEYFHPLTADMQQLVAIQPRIRLLELRVAQTYAGDNSLLFRKLPKRGTPENSWSSSAEQAVLAAAGKWGHFESDHNIKRYLFHPDPHQRASVELPHPADLFDRFLASSVIDSIDHPYVQEQFGELINAQSSVLAQAAQSALDDEGDDDEMY